MIGAPGVGLKIDAVFHQEVSAVLLEYIVILYIVSNYNSIMI